MSSLFPPSRTLSYPEKKMPFEIYNSYSDFNNAAPRKQISQLKPTDQGPVLEKHQVHSKADAEAIAHIPKDQRPRISNAGHGHVHHRDPATTAPIETRGQAPVAVERPVGNSDPALRDEKAAVGCCGACRPQ